MSQIIQQLLSVAWGSLCW